MRIAELINLLEEEEKLAISAYEEYKETLSENELQMAMNIYCNNVAKNLIKKFTPLLYEYKFRYEIKKYLKSVTSKIENNKESVSKSFYNKIIELDKKIGMLERS